MTVRHISLLNGRTVSTITRSIVPRKLLSVVGQNCLFCSLDRKTRKINFKAKGSKSCEIGIQLAKLGYMIEMQYIYMVTLETENMDSLLRIMTSVI